MDIYILKTRWKLLLLVAACAIGVGSLWYTHSLVRKLSLEERKKVELWAEATRLLAQNAPGTDLNFPLKIIENNTTVPVILCDQQNNVVFFRNMDSSKVTRKSYFRRELAIMKRKHAPIIITLPEGKRNYIYYNDSILIRKLTVYPYVQLFVILIFMIAAYVAFNASRKAEQNKVWLGLSRETAHQLGTPTSSLMAWVELLKEKSEGTAIIDELEKDVIRLSTITERFSKIGSQPVLEPVNIFPVLIDVVSYMKNRMPATVTVDIEAPDVGFVFVRLNTQLFSWVIENLLKNSLDALKNIGSINVKVTTDNKLVYLDISDNGSGISKKNIKRIFKPGFTTKSRGWGLGLSLAKRIIENYHHGRIFVLHSEMNLGTTFRLILPLHKTESF